MSGQISAAGYSGIQGEKVQGLYREKAGGEELKTGNCKNGRMRVIKQNRERGEL